jgi:hypothetical protein
VNASANPEKFFEEHGVSPKVWKARPYGVYTPTDPGAVREAYTSLPQQGQRAYMTGLSRQSDDEGPIGGLVITRHPPPDMGLQRVFAELRPDRSVKTGPPYCHCHPTKRPTEAPLHPSTGQPLAKRHIHTADAMRKHIERDKAEDDHRGVNTEEIHWHQPRGKYVFPPSPRREKVWHHDHDEVYEGKPEKRSEHVRRHHGGVDLPGSHRHSRMVKDKSKSLARRLDIHPHALANVTQARRVFYGIEGCIKADAILSAGEAVFSVPSVTLWDPPELQQFAEKYLVGKIIVIVPDADWFKNPLVYTQAMLCRSTLRRVRLDALVAAPPIERLKEDIKGVDDFLAADGRIDDLEVIGREAPFLEIAEWVSRHGWRRDRMARDAQVLESLALHAAPSDGTLRVSLRTLARVMGVRVNRVSRGVEDLLEYGAIEVDKPLVTQRGMWRGNYFDPALEWEDRPIITVAPALRAADLPIRRLGEIEGSTLGRAA